MKVTDTTGLLFWTVKQAPSLQRPASQLSVNRTLYNKMREPIKRATSTMTPAMNGYYAEGRANLKRHLQGFVETRAFSEAYSSSLQRAQMSDEDIAALVERLNLTPR